MLRESEARRVLIAGSGIAGLAMARALHARDVPYAAFERRSAYPDGGLAINLPGNAVQALVSLGVGGGLRHLGSPVRRREYRTGHGRLLFAIDEDAFWGEGTGSRCVRRSDLMRLLASGLPEKAFRENLGVAALRQSPSAIEVEMSDGSVETGDFLVGADGVHSTVRRAVFGNRVLEAAVLANASWRFMAPNPGIDCWTLWAGTEGMFLLIPVDRGEVYGWVTVSREPSTKDDLASARHAFDRFPTLVRETLAAALKNPVPLHHSPLHEVRIPAWSDARVTLIGDAAHATAPVWAQGAALSIEDALVLGRLLAEHDDWAQVGVEYERQRRPRVAHVQSMTDRSSRAARMPGIVRNTLLPILGPRLYRASYGPLRASA